MMRMEAVYGCGDGLTPDVAAKLTQAAERYRARLELECGGKRVLLDSLIGILSLECPRNSRLTIFADGEDAQAAAEAIREILEKRG
ncbi:MAG: HPr family phosphocarrier protein [Clostridia bacterium]|nr:HPr family phosphocarrier protein [Clostridia bacterium]